MIKMIKIKNFTRVLEDVKKNQMRVLELRYTVSKINSLDGFSNRYRCSIK